MASKFDFSNRPRKEFTPGDIPGLFSGLGNAAAPGMIVQLPLGKLIAWANQPFKPYSEEKMRQLIEDIKANGVLNPIIVRPKGEQYEILAGHNRWNASRKAGLETIPAIIKVVDDATATLIMVNTNLNQRDELLYSEKAWAYRLQMEAMNRQGHRTDLTSPQNASKYRSDDEAAKSSGVSGDTLRRYIRLTHLIPELLEMVDKDMLPMVSGVALSYLEEKQQQIVCDISAECDKRISTASAEQIKHLGQAGNFSADAVRRILLPAKRWNPANAFVSRSRGLIPKTATEKDIEQVAQLIKDFFKGNARSNT